MKGIAFALKDACVGSMKHANFVPMGPEIMTKPRICKSTAIAWAGGSQADLAARLGISASAVSQWDEELPDGRAWQLFALGCPQDNERADASTAGFSGQ